MELDHNKKIKAYISGVCSQIRFRDIHQDVKLELETHIQEISKELLAQGFSEKEAVEKAIAQMGDADIVGKQLNRIHKPKPEWSVLLFSFLFITIGLLALYLIEKQDLLTYSIQIFVNSLRFSFMSLISIIGLYFFDYRKLERYSKHIYLGTLLILTFTILWGNQANGSRSWLTLGSFNINFVAISPLLFMAALSGFFNKWDWDSNFKLLQGLVLFIVPLILILKARPPISTGFIYSIAGIVIMTVSGAKLQKLFVIFCSFMTLLILSIVTEPQGLERILVFLNPAADPLGSGYLNIQLNKIISNSGLLGQGLTFDPHVLPDLHTDFIFAFITYTFGWIASILLITFIVIFLIRMANIARQVKYNYAKLLISGFISILAMQFLWNIAMNLGLAPISGLGLPFISYSGSQLIIDAATVGIISSIYRRKNISNSSTPII